MGESEDLFFLRTDAVLRTNLVLNSRSLVLLVVSATVFGLLRKPRKASSYGRILFNLSNCFFALDVANCFDFNSK